VHVQHDLLQLRLIGPLSDTECPESTKKKNLREMLQLQHLCVDRSLDVPNNEQCDRRFSSTEPNQAAYEKKEPDNV
jgi:hypothetical protein